MSITKLRKKMRHWLAKLFWGALLVIFVIGAFAGFGRLGGGGPGTVGRSSPPKIVARVNGKALYRDRFNIALAQQMRMARSMSGSETVPISQVEQVKQQALEQMIELLSKLQAAKRERVRVSGREIRQQIDMYVDKEFARIQSEADSPKLFERRVLEKFGSMEKLKDTIRANILEDAVREQVLLTNLEKKVKDRVQVDEKEYREGTVKIKARLIQIQPEPPFLPGPSDKGKSKGASQAEREAAARAKAEDLLRQIKAGMDFAQLAKANSQDATTAPKGGFAGEIGVGERKYLYGDEFEKIAFKLKAGEVSDVFRSEGAYYIVKVESRRYDIPPDFDEVNYTCLDMKCGNRWSGEPGARACPKCKKEKIQQGETKKKEYIDRYREQKQMEAWGEFTDKLRRKTNVVVLDPELKAQRIMYMPTKAKEAISLLTKALEYADGQDTFVRSAPIRYTLAMLYRQEKQYDKAIEQLREALAVEESGELHMELARIFKDQKKRKQAVEELKLAVDLAGREPHLYRQLAALLRDVGEKTLAAQQEEKAKENEKRRGGFNMPPIGM